MYIIIKRVYAPHTYKTVDKAGIYSLPFQNKYPRMITITLARKQIRDTIKTCFAFSTKSYYASTDVNNKHILSNRTILGEAF